MKLFNPKTLVRSVLAAVAIAACSTALSAETQLLDVEKDELKFGFIKLTDMAPMAVAYEKGYFEDEGLFVTLEPQANWKVLLDRVITGELDGAHMLAGQPLAATIGFGTKAHIVTPLSMDLNGNGITVSNEIWEMMKPHIRGNIHPGYYSPTDVSGQIKADALLSVTPPPQMPATMEAGTIHGYCVGEPWNQQAVFKGIGVPVITDYELWKNNPEKVFGFTKEFTEENPNTTLAVVKAMIRAAKWLDENNNANRLEAVEILSRSEYVGADAEVIANSMTGTFEYEKGDKREIPDFNVFYRYFATYPYYSDAVWYLTQMRRWGQIDEYKEDTWYDEVARDVYKPEIYLTAAKLLVEEGYVDEADFPWGSDGYREPTSEFIDQLAYDGKQPNAYIDSMQIGLKAKQRVGDTDVSMVIK